MSNLFPREFINELLSRCDLVELIDSRVPLKKKGSNYLACCPFHNEKTASFTVSPAKQIYHCFGCQVSGNAFSFLMEYDRLNFPEAVEQLAQELSIPIPNQIQNQKPNELNEIYQVLENAAVFYQDQLKKNQTAINYLKKRGLTGKIAKNFAIGYAPDQWDSLLKHCNNPTLLLAAGLIIKKNEGGYYDRFRNRIMFPIRNRRGRVIGFGGRTIQDEEPKYLNSPETAAFHKGQELYGLYEVSKATRNIDRLLVVEGYMDVVALAQLGIPYVAATLGTATSVDHIQRLFRLTSEVVFCFDGDAAGQNAAWRALESSLSVIQDGWNIRFLLLPEKEDPDSLVRKEGHELFSQRIAKSISLADFFFQHLSQELDMTSAEGKASLAKKAGALIEKIPQTVFKQIMFDRLADIITVNSSVLKNIVTHKKPKGNNEVVVKQPVKNKVLQRSAMRLAIALLIQNPNLAQSVANFEEIKLLTIPGSELLQQVLTHARHTADINTAQLLELWRDHPEIKTLQQLATWETDVPAAGVEQELLGILEKLLKNNHAKRIDELLQKAKLKTISDSEKIELQQLIAVK